MTTIDEQIAWANDLVSDLRMPHRLRFMHKAILASLEELKRIQSAEIGGKTLDNDNELLREARELLNEDWCGTSADSVGSKLISRINAHLASAEASQPASRPDDPRTAFSERYLSSPDDARARSIVDGFNKASQQDSVVVPVSKLEQWHESLSNREKCDRTYICGIRMDIDDMLRAAKEGK